MWVWGKWGQMPRCIIYMLSWRREAANAKHPLDFDLIFRFPRIMPSHPPPELLAAQHHRRRHRSLAAGGRKCSTVRCHCSVFYWGALEQGVELLHPRAETSSAGGKTERTPRVILRSNVSSKYIPLRSELLASWAAPLKQLSLGLSALLKGTSVVVIWNSQMLIWDSNHQTNKSSTFFLVALSLSLFLLKLVRSYDFQNHQP